MTVTFPFDGDDTDKYALLNAVGRNCVCPRDELGYPDGSCSAHALLRDRRAVGALIFERHGVERLEREEWQGGTDAD